jgi:hypothetical protein
MPVPSLLVIFKNPAVLIAAGHAGTGALIS